MPNPQILKAMRLQARHAASFDEGDVPKRCVNMGYCCYCLNQFGAPVTALVVFGFFLFLEVTARILRHFLPEDDDLIPAHMVYAVFLRVFLAITVFSISAVLLAAQPHQAALTIALVYFGGLTLHTISAHALVSFMNWLVLPGFALSMCAICYLAAFQDYAPYGDGDRFLIIATALMWGLALIGTVSRQSNTRQSYTNAVIDAKERAERLNYLSRHDALTGLMNRMAFDEVLLDALQFASPQAQIAVFLIDLDKFKPINDTYGHAAGDAALAEMGARIEHAVGTGYAARLGGDEFAALIPSANDRSWVAEVARALKHQLHQPIAFEGHTLELGASIGIAFGSTSAETQTSICARADHAMYAAKSANQPVPVFANDLDLAS